MDFRVLGPVVVDGGAPVALRRKPRALLALLLVEPSRPRSTDVLIERLWQGRSPPTAGSALRVHLSALRAALCPPGSEVSRLGRTSNGYIVTVEDGELDSQCFTQAVRAAEPLVERQPAEAGRLLHDALGLWRGDPFSNIDDVDGVDVLRQHLLGSRLHATALLADALLASGQNEQLAVDAVHWLAEFPTSEHLAGRQVVALYRTGDQVGALRAWRNFVEQLVDEYGVDVTPEFRALESRLLLQSEPRDRPREVPPAPPPAADEPPTVSIDLVERDHVLNEVLAALQATPAGGRAIVTIWGEAGIGKTSLLRDVRRVVGSPVFVSGRAGAAPLSLVDDVAQQLGGARTLSLVEDGGVAHGHIVAELLTLLEERGHPVIVVDDVDVCDDDSLEIARRLVAAGAGPWVTTSRAGDLSTHPLLRDRDALARSHSVQLHPLSRAGIAALVERHGWLSVTPDDIDRLEHGTAGNPFLVVALARSAAAGAEVTEIPRQATEHVRRLVAELGEGSAAWFECIALDRTPVVDVDTAGVVAGLDHERSIEIAESALALGLLGDRDGELTFRHSIVREAVVEGVSALRRRRMHTMLANALLAQPRPVSVERLAEHLRMSHAPELRRAAAQATANEAEAALVNGAVLAADERFELAASLGERAGLASPTLLAWRLRRCDALVASGRLLEAQRLATSCAQAARRERDRDNFVDAVIRAVGPIIPIGGIRVVAEELVVEALEWCAADGVPPAVRLCEAAARVVISRVDPVAVRVRGDIRAPLEIASDRAGDPADQALALLGLRSLGWSDGEHATARSRRSVRALAMATRSEEIWLQMRAHRALVTDLFASASPELAAALRRYGDEARRVGSPYHGWCAARVAVAWMRARGDEQAAAESALAAASLESAVDDDARSGAFVAEVVTEHVRTGRLADLHAVSNVGDVDSDVAPTVQLGRLAIAAEAGATIDPGSVDRAVAEASHGPLRAAACAFAVLAVRAARLEGRLVPVTLGLVVDALTPHSGGVVLIEGGIGCLGPADAYLAYCHELLGADAAAQYHRRLGEEVASTFVPAWAGWRVEREA